MDTRKKHVLATNASANGNYPSDSGEKLEGGRYQLFLTGDFHGATATVKAGANASTFTAYSEGAFTAASCDYILEIGKGGHVLVALSNVGSPTPSISAVLVPVPEEGEAR